MTRGWAGGGLWKDNSSGRDRAEGLSGRSAAFDPRIDVGVLGELCCLRFRELSVLKGTLSLYV